ncbi:hypothetical protein [Streptomyces sp. NPDC058394]|uniref:hypothetical protein n=1 Tax=Streptomyces sp. NPDC058394 TaxID=3346477 RepID=UPI0036490BAA
MASAPCGPCCGSGQRMVTVSHAGADGTLYQGVEMQTCTACGGTGSISTGEDG